MQPTADPAASLHLGAHLRVVGTFLESHVVYQRPKLETIKLAALHIMSALGGKYCALSDIKEALCFEDIPLVSEEVLRQALNALRSEGKIERLEKSPRVYRLITDPPPNTTTLDQLIDQAWRAHFAGTAEGTQTDFRRGLSVLFARYGCSAFDTLNHNETDNVQIGRAHV